jgi:transposase
MKAYSMDLRERVVAACDAGDATREQVAARFAVSVRWVRDLLGRRREAGSIAPRPRGGGRHPAFDEAAAGRLRDAVRADETPRWRNSAGRLASPAAPRRCTGR